MKITKMNISGQLSNEDSARFSRRIGLSYVIAAIGAAVAGLIAALSLWR